MLRRLALSLVVALALAPAAANALGWPPAYEAVERELGSRDPAVRLAAARALAQVPERVLQRLLPVALDDPESEVRLAAASASLSRNVPGVGARVVSWLMDADLRLRIAGARVLARSPDRRAISALGRGLSDPDPEARAAMAEALGATASDEAVAPLVSRLDDAVPLVREVAVRALGRLGFTGAVVPLIGKIQDAHIGVRIEVIRALAALGDARAANPLILALQDKDRAVRTETLSALGALGSEAAVPALIAASRSSLVPSEQAHAVRALSKIPTEQSLRGLVALLELRLDPEVQDALADAFARLGARAVPALAGCLTGRPSRSLSDRCVTMLGKTRARAAVTPVLGAMGQGLPSLSVVLQALGGLDDPNALSAVLEFLRHDDPAVRRAAIAAAKKLLDPSHPDGRAVEPIEQALGAARLEPGERESLIELLGFTGALRAAPFLSSVARTATAPALRIEAIEALGRLGPASEDATLLEALGDESGALRFAAALALRTSGSARVAPVLVERLARAAEQDRMALALALMGPLSRAPDRKLAGRVLGVIRTSRDDVRDALIEALGRMPGRAGSGALQQLARAPNPLERAKVAEALSGHPGAQGLLLRLVRDDHARVRANAVWALGSVASAASLPAIRRLLADRDVMVAANAAAALSRAAARQRSNVTDDLCALLEHRRAYVRANALGALRYLGVQCPARDPLELLEKDPSDVVRSRAALLASEIETSDRVRRALTRCLAEDPSGMVSASCAGGEPVSRRLRHAVTLFVVPAGEAEPVPGAPFTLLRADGLMRLGFADRRGAVFEADAPEGEIRLLVPGPGAD